MSDQHTDSTPKSVQASLNEGTAYAVTLGAGETYFGAFAVWLGASAQQIGLLGTLPPFLGSLAQLLSLSFLGRQHHRVPVLVRGAYLHAFCLLPIAALALPALASFNRGLLLLVGVSFYFIAVGATVPVWTSLIGDVIPSSLRASFFARRTRRNGIVSFVAIVAASQVLDYFKDLNQSAMGFLAILAAAFIARLVSAYYLGRHEDPPYAISDEHYFSFWQFLARVRHSNFTRFVMFVSTMNFGVAIAGPFFAVYMLRDLHLSYSEFMLVTTAAIVAQFLTMRHWGALSENIGNKALLSYCGLGIAIVPVFWLFSSNIVWLLCIQAFSGMVWAGFNLAVLNFMFDAVTPPKRARCAAYQGIINGLFVLTGSVVGAALIPVLPESFTLVVSGRPIGSALPYLFFLSGIVRLFAVGLLLRKFAEVREVPAADQREIFLRIIHIRPIYGAIFSIAGAAKRRVSKNSLTLI